MFSMLTIRMGLYLVFGVLAGQGLVVFDADAGTVMFRIEDLMTLATGITGFAATFVTSRFAKKR